MCLKGSCFPDCLKVPVFKNVGERSTAKKPLVFFLWLKLVNKRIVDHLEKCGLSSDFQYDYRSSDQIQIF